MRMVQKHGTPLLLLIVGTALGFFLSAHWVPNVAAVGRQDYESLEAFSNVLAIVRKNVANSKRIIRGVADLLPGMSACRCGQSLRNAIITDRKRIPASARRRLSLLIGNYL